ncbi:hypothetical protein ROHU_024428 [Labeo rohita]|uniref:Uncharacterized protein n=1 Tax=Labeo rohita TaxID=84645 RepID=A0A498MJB9_LABRO|nr:hypothetical protein ROHU_024428 [Labeo rohita]
MTPIPILIPEICTENPLLLISLPVMAVTIMFVWAAPCSQKDTEPEAIPQSSVCLDIIKKAVPEFPVCPTVAMEADIIPYSQSSHLKAMEANINSCSLITYDGYGIQADRLFSEFSCNGHRSLPVFLFK